MSTISILPAIAAQDGYRAVSGQAQSLGKTPGQALDSLTELLDQDEYGTLVVIQRLRPDRFFTAEQQQRLSDLMTRWRAARDSGGPWSPEEQAELDALVEAEVQGAGERAAALLKRLAT